MTSSTSPRSCASATPARLGDTPVRAWWSGRAHGDQRGLGPGRAAPAPVPAGSVVRRLHQLHGNGVVVVGAADAPAATTVASPESIPDGDAVVSAERASVLAVLTADCAPVALGSPGGTRAAVHAGWRGLGAGVIRRAVEVMGELGAERVVAGIGPTIGPCCYEFSPTDLDRLSAAFGDGVRAESRRGRPALDLPAAVRVALGRAGAELVVDAPACTACTACPACGGYFSHRARGERQRQAVFVWRDGSGG